MDIHRSKALWDIFFIVKDKLVEDMDEDPDWPKLVKDVHEMKKKALAFDAIIDSLAERVKEKIINEEPI